MIGIGDKILHTVRIVSNSLIMRAASLCCGLLIICSSQLLSQVITNEGAAITITPGIIILSGDAVNNSGVLSNNGTITLTGNYISTSTTSGNGIYTLGGSWTNSGGIFVPGSSTVIFNGSDDQLITRTGGETFFNLIVENSGAQLLKRLAIRNNVTVLGTLTMSLGNIDAGTYLLYLSNPLASALKYISTTGSRIFGKFERGISQKATYLFPLGTSSFYNPLNIKTNETPVAGSVVSQYFSLDPGNTGLPIPDPPVEIHDRYPDGYWSLTAKNYFSSDNFSISLDAAGFIDTIRDVTRVIKRIDGGTWIVDGTHRDADETVVNRENLTGDISASGTQFALGRVRPLMISHPRDTVVCENTNPFFKVIASGAEKLKYTWYKEPGTLIENDGHYSGARTPILTITGAVLSDAGEYYCIITDRYRNSTRSNNATLVVMKIPEAKVTPEEQPDECSNIAFEDIILGLNYWDPGTTFVWSRNILPQGITTTIPETGSANNIGDVLSGKFVNTTDSPVKITFVVTPVGPEPTKCVGEPVSAFIVVNPTPRVIPINALPVICSGEPTSIKLTTPSKMTSGDIVFDYTVAFEGLPGELKGEVGADEPGSLNPDNFITYRYTNSSDTILSVLYTITPRNYSLGCVYDSIRIPEVEVHPLPLQNMFISTPFTCEGGINGVITAVLAKGSKPDVLTWTERPWVGDTTYTTTANTILQPVRYAGQYNLEVKDSYGCSNSINHLRVPGTIFITNFDATYISDYGTTCNGRDDGEIFIYESGSSTPPYEYWLVFNEADTIRSGIISSRNIYTYEKNLPAGDYKLIIRDANGCYNRSFPTTQIIEPPVIEVTFGESDYNGFNITCKGDNDGSVWTTSVTGGNGGPFSYMWTTEGGNISGPANTNKLDNIPAGAYYLTTTDIRGCERKDTIVIDEPDGMTLDYSKLSWSPDNAYNISCNGGNTGTIDMTISGGAQHYDYLWTNSTSWTATTEDIKELTAGTYVCKVTDRNGCELKIPPLSIYPAFTLTEPSAIFFHAKTSTSADGSYNINCNDSTGWVDLNVTGGSGGSYVFTWGTDGGAGIVPGEGDQPALKAGTYFVNVKDSYGCEKDTVIILTQPAHITATLVPTHITCQPAGFANGSIDLTAPGGGIAPYGSWSWSNGAVTEDISGLGEGYHRITFTDANGCPYTDSVRINLPDPIAFMPLISDYNGYNVTCNGKSDGWINITMNSGLEPYVYDWTKIDGEFSENSESVSGLSRGFYILKVTDANICTITDTIEIREPGVFGINILKSSSIVGGFNINCAGGSTGSVEIETVNQAGSVTYLWSDGATTAARTNIPGGDYRIYVEDANGCRIDSLFTLTAPDSMKLSFEVIQPWCPDKPDGEIHLTVTGGVVGTDYSYQWSDGSTGRDIMDIIEGNFVVTVTDLNGCALIDSVFVEPQNETCLIIPNAFSPNGDLINDLWNIGLIELYPDAEIKIFNRWGGTVWRSEKGYPHPWDGRSNGSLLPIDSYHYIIELGKKRKPVIGNVTIVR